jgi:membrane protein implicated in regulation of membrane protease activity
MGDMFASLGTWNWLIFGLILMGLELLAPGVFLAAFLVGVLSFVIDLAWQCSS